MIKLLKGLFRGFGKDKTSPIKTTAIIIPRAEHAISRKSINPNALKVLYRLHEAGFSAFLVGGCVRDLLLGRRPKDFDVATNALPEEIRKLFRNCRLIGKRFRLAHIVFGRDIIEVATFRTHHQNATHEHHAHSIKGMIVRDNVYGSIEDDADRRDFSINALYYNIADFTVLDYANGMADITHRCLRIIGEPDKRFHEDPVRILRAIRFTAKLNLTISPETEEPLSRLAYLLENVSSARLYQEVLKFFQEGATLPTVLLLHKYKIFSRLFPQTHLDRKETEILLNLALQNTDDRYKNEKTVSPTFLFAVFLWHAICEHTLRFEAEGFPIYVAVEQSIHHVIKLQTQRLAIPKALLTSVREICVLQHRFTQRYGIRPYRVLEHPRYRAAYDLLMLRSQTQEPVEELYLWWTQFAQSDRPTQDQMLKAVEKTRRPKKKRKYRKKG